VVMIVQRRCVRVRVGLCQERNGDGGGSWLLFFGGDGEMRCEVVRGRNVYEMCFWWQPGDSTRGLWVGVGVVGGVALSWRRMLPPVGLAQPQPQAPVFWAVQPL
jgi:hypothetical protein